MRNSLRRSMCLVGLETAESAIFCLSASGRSVLELSRPASPCRLVSLRSPRDLSTHRRRSAPIERAHQRQLRPQLLGGLGGARLVADHMRVIRTRNSVRVTLSEVVPNKLPATGMSSRPGMPVLLLVRLSLMRPPRATVWPSCTATVLEMRRSWVVGESSADVVVGANKDGIRAVQRFRIPVRYEGRATASVCGETERPSARSARFAVLRYFAPAAWTIRREVTCQAAARPTRPAIEMPRARHRPVRNTMRSRASNRLQRRRAGRRSFERR
jgi:hypothetical protein